MDTEGVELKLNVGWIDLVAKDTTPFKHISQEATLNAVFVPMGSNFNES